MANVPIFSNYNVVKPHTHGVNHLHFARVITNPHVNMTDPFNLNRPDGDYVSTSVPAEIFFEKADL